MTGSPLAWEGTKSNHLAMEQTAEKFLAYSWLKLLGLEIPIATVLWSFLFCEISKITTVPTSIYQFLFVAAWGAIMATRLIHVLRNPDIHVTDPSLLFTKSNWGILLALTLISTIYGIWLMLFQLGIGIISYAILPCLFCFLYLNKGQNKHIDLSMSAYGAMAFASAVPIPAFFYSLSHSVIIPFYIPNLQILFYPPFWILAGLICLFSLCRTVDNHREFHRIRSFIPLLTGTLVFAITYQMISLNPKDSEFWLLGSMGAGTVMLYYIHQVSHRFW